MNAFRKKHSGVTMLEALLVLAIIGSMLTVGFNQYRSYKLDNDLRKVAYNIDSLFLAASFYYRANCGSQKSGTGTSIPGKLSPWYLPTPGQNVSLNITTDLLNAGYLKTAIPQNPLINNSAAGGGYTVQFNKVTFPRMINACTGAGCTPVPTQIGTTWDWKIQVGVTFVNSTTAQTAQYILQANCLSTKNTQTNMLVNCSDISAFTSSCISLISQGGSQNLQTANNNGCPMTTNVASYTNYILFERNPSFPNNKPGEGLWGMMPIFTQSYQSQTTYSLTYLLTTGHTPEFQYFVCGT